MNYRIIADSSAGLTKKMVDKFNITIIPLTYTGEDGTIYTPDINDGETQSKTFYDDMRNKKTFKTSCISESTFEEVFESILKNGEDLIYFALSSGLSATYSCAEKVASKLKDIYKDRKSCSISSLLFQK